MEDATIPLKRSKYTVEDEEDEEESEMDISAIEAMIPSQIFNTQNEDHASSHNTSNIANVCFIYFKFVRPNFIIFVRVYKGSRSGNY